jgi:hypothetical protein
MTHLQDLTYVRAGVLDPDGGSRMHALHFLLNSSCSFLPSFKAGDRRECFFFLRICALFAQKGRHVTSETRTKKLLRTDFKFANAQAHGHAQFCAFAFAHLHLRICICAFRISAQHQSEFRISLCISGRHIPNGSLQFVSGE